MHRSVPMKKLLHRAPTAWGLIQLHDWIQLTVRTFGLYPQAPVKLWKCSSRKLGIRIHRGPIRGSTVKDTMTVLLLQGALSIPIPLAP